MERFTFAKDSAIGPYMGSDPNGMWCEWPVANARITALETALAAMTAERDARDVAIGVLADRVRSCEHMLACYRVGRRPSDVALDTASHTAQEVDANPLARAAVEGER